MGMAQPPAGTGAPMSRTTESPPSQAAEAYVEKAATGDMFEIRAGRLAIERSKDERVRSLARTLIDDHSRLSANLHQALQVPNVGVKVPDRLDAEHEAMLARLEQAEGEAFDELYLSGQRKAHEEALRLHSDFARHGDHTALKSFALTAASIVEGHLVRIRDVLAR